MKALWANGLILFGAFTSLGTFAKAGEVDPKTFYSSVTTPKDQTPHCWIPSTSSSHSINIDLEGKPFNESKIFSVSLKHGGPFISRESFDFDFYGSNKVSVSNYGSGSNAYQLFYHISNQGFVGGERIREVKGLVNSAMVIVYMEVLEVDRDGTSYWSGVRHCGEIPEGVTFESFNPYSHVLRRASDI